MPLAVAILLLLSTAAGALADPAVRVSGRISRPDQEASAVGELRGGPQQPCVLRAYVAEYLSYEFPYLFGAVLSGVQRRCGCWLRVLPRGQLLRDASGGNVSGALIISGTNADAWPSFAADLAALRRQVRLWLPFSACAGACARLPTVDNLACPGNLALARPS